MFTKNDVVERISDMDVLTFLEYEPLDVENPNDFYAHDLTAFGEMPTVHIRIPVKYKSAIDMLWEEVKQQTPVNANMSALLRKIAKHGAMQLTKNEYFNEFKKLKEIRIRLTKVFGVKRSKYFDYNFARKLDHLMVARQMVGARINTMFGMSSEDISFRSYPKWHVVISSYADTVGISTYANYRVALGLSLDTAFAVFPDAQFINSTLYEALMMYKGVFIGHLGEYIEKYEDITGINLLKGVSVHDGGSK